MSKRHVQMNDLFILPYIINMGVYISYDSYFAFVYSSMCVYHYIVLSQLHSPLQLRHPPTLYPMRRIHNLCEWNMLIDRIALVK